MQEDVAAQRGILLAPVAQVFDEEDEQFLAQMDAANHGDLTLSRQLEEEQPIDAVATGQLSTGDQGSPLADQENLGPSGMQPVPEQQSPPRSSPTSASNGQLARLPITAASGLQPVPAQQRLASPTAASAVNGRLDILAAMAATASPPPATTRQARALQPLPQNIFQPVCSILLFAPAQGLANRPPSIACQFTATLVACCIVFEVSAGSTCAQPA